MKRFIELIQLFSKSELDKELKVLMTNELLIEPPDLLKEIAANQERACRKVGDNEHDVLVDMPIRMFGKNTYQIISPEAFNAT